MSPVEQDEYHLISIPDVGHVPSLDCWCEPAVIYYVDAPEGAGLIKVIEHDEPSKKVHALVLKHRDEHPDWVTAIFDEVSGERN